MCNAAPLRVCIVPRRADEALAATVHKKAVACERQRLRAKSQLLRLIVVITSSKAEAGSTGAVSGERRPNTDGNSQSNESSSNGERP